MDGRSLDDPSDSFCFARVDALPIHPPQRLKTLDGSMFEFVDASSMQLTPNSMATR